MGVADVAALSGGRRRVRLPLLRALLRGALLMSANGIAQIVFYLAVLTALTPPLGAYMARVFEGRRVPGLTRVLGPVERGTYRLLRIDPAREQDWKAYATAVLAFSVASFAVLYAILRLQGHLPLNPNDYPGMSWNVAFNTASSFVTNTNWQFYGGETTLSYLSQMAGLTVQNFVSAAVGMAVLAAVIRGFARRGTGALGNFWADLVRITLYILLPLSIVVGARPRLAGRHPDLRRPGHATRPSRRGRSAPPTRPARPPPRRSTAARSPRRSRSSSSAPTAAATSTPTRRCPSRTRRR